jgi:undecaprenyl diphosphate synthase
LEQGVEYLTLFAFSTENWRRPAEEVSLLQRLFIDALRRQSHELHQQGIRFKVVGDLARLEPALVRLIQEARR